MTTNGVRASSCGIRLARFPSETPSRTNPYLDYPPFRVVGGSGTDERACASGAAFCNEAAVFQARKSKTLPADLNSFRKLNGALPRV